MVASKSPGLTIVMVPTVALALINVELLMKLCQEQSIIVISFAIVGHGFSAGISSIDAVKNFTAKLLLLHLKH